MCILFINENFTFICFYFIIKNQQVYFSALHPISKAYYP